MWPFKKPTTRSVVVLHIDEDGQAKGAYFRGDAEVLIIDERDTRDGVYRMSQQTPADELRRRIGKHPLRHVVDQLEENDHTPVLNLHWSASRRPYPA